MSVSEVGGRERYHHGDLHQALIDAGLDLAREGGPDAVVLREATRRVGVSPNAAYRHFADRDALLDAVSSASMAQVAAAIDARFDAIQAEDPKDVACGHLRAVGTGYVAFALEEPGLFRTAFFVPADLRGADVPEKAGPSGRTPYQLLTLALDELVACGLMPASRRPGAEFLAWSAVHGFALLVIEGPLRSMAREQVDATAQRVIDMVEAGFTK